MTTFVASGFIEALQDYIGADSTLDYTVGTNLHVGRVVDIVEEFPALVAADRHTLTMFEDGGSIIRSGRRTGTERTIRFFIRGDHGQDAINRCWTLHQWFENSNKHILLTGFVVLFLRTETLPNIVQQGQDNTALAEFTITFHVQNRVT